MAQLQNIKLTAECAKDADILCKLRREKAIFLPISNFSYSALSAYSSVKRICNKLSNIIVIIGNNKADAKEHRKRGFLEIFQRKSGLVRVLRRTLVYY